MSKSLTPITSVRSAAEHRDPTLQSASSEEVAMPGERVGFLRRISHTIPTLLVLAALGGLAYWGHHTGWTMPSFSTLKGEKQPQPPDWCEEHSVPESDCVECKPDLMPKLKDYGWCQEHGVHQCTLDHPSLAQMKSPPEITSAHRQRVKEALAIRERSKNNNRCPLYKRRIQFASMEAMSKAGVDVALVEEQSVTEVVTAPGEIVYDQTRTARLSSRAPGIVWQVDSQVGDRVQAGEILALIDAADVGRLKAELLQAYVRLDLKNKLLEGMRSAKSAIPGRSIQEAEAEAREARIRLLSARQALVNLGLPLAIENLSRLTEEQLMAHLQLLGLPTTIKEKLDTRSTTTNLLPIKAPFAGIVVERNVVVGEVVSTEKHLFVVADTSQMWLNLDVRQEDVKYVHLGQKVQFSAREQGTEISGTIMWMSTTADEKTRTVKVRAQLSNPDGQLRASTFGTGSIILREEPRAVVVPSESLQWDGSCYIVFVRDKHFFEKDAPKVFHTRTVRPGVKTEGRTEIIVGVLPGEVVASKGSGVLRAELLKNNLGAG